MNSKIKKLLAVGGAASLGTAIWFVANGNPDNNLEETISPTVKEKIYFKEAVGKKAPDFELESINGKIVKLSDYLGKNVVLFFNEGAMCYPACWDQVEKLGSDDRFNTENIAAFSIVTDTRKQWLDIVSKTPSMAKSKIIFDTSRSVSKAYDVLYLDSPMHPGVFPGHTYFIIDKEGVIRFTLDDPNMALANDRLIAEIEKLNK